MNYNIYLYNITSINCVKQYCNIIYWITFFEIHSNEYLNRLSIYLHHIIFNIFVNHRYNCFIPQKIMMI